MIKKMMDSFLNIIIVKTGTLLTTLTFIFFQRSQQRP